MGKFEKQSDPQTPPSTSPYFQKAVTPPPWPMTEALFLERVKQSLGMGATRHS